MNNPLKSRPAGARAQSATMDPLADLALKLGNLDLKPLRFFRGAGSAAGIVGTLEMIFAPTSAGSLSPSTVQMINSYGFWESAVSDFTAPEAQFDGPARMPIPNTDLDLVRVAPFLNAAVPSGSMYDSVSVPSDLSVGTARESVTLTPAGPITALPNPTLSYQVGAIGSLVGRMREAMSQFRFDMRMQQEQISLELNKHGGIELLAFPSTSFNSTYAQELSMSFAQSEWEADYQEELWDEWIEQYREEVLIPRQERAQRSTAHNPAAAQLQRMEAQNKARRTMARKNKKQRRDRKFQGKAPKLMRLLGPMLSAVEKGDDMITLAMIFAASMKDEHGVSVLDVLMNTYRDSDDPIEFRNMLLKRAAAWDGHSFDYKGFFGGLATHFAFETAGKYLGANARFFIPQEGFSWTETATEYDTWLDG